MWTAITLALKAAASGAWSILRALPWWLYLLVLAIALQLWALAAAHSAGDRTARAELAPVLMQAHADVATRLQQAADAEGRALAYKDGLNSCIGARASVDLLTGAVLAQREKARAAAVVARITIRQELDNVYETIADRCANYPVPAAVLRVLDTAAFGKPLGVTNPGGGDTSTTVHAGARDAYAGDANPSPAGAAYSTTYGSLSVWIADGWAPALQACNADKSAIAALRNEP